MLLYLLSNITQEGRRKVVGKGANLTGHHLEFAILSYSVSAIFRHT